MIDPKKLVPGATVVHSDHKLDYTVLCVGERSLFVRGASTNDGAEYIILQDVYDRYHVKPEVFYLNIYPKQGGNWRTGGAHGDVYEADSGASKARLARVRVEFVEGQYDD